MPLGTQEDAELAPPVLVCQEELLICTLGAQGEQSSMPFGAARTEC